MEWTVPEEFWIGIGEDDEPWLQPVFGPDRSESDDVELPQRGIKRVTIEGDLYGRYALAMDEWLDVLIEIRDLYQKT
jgi:hypothetical protein